MNTRILTTADKFTEAECYNEAGLLESDMIGKFKDIQKVISLGKYAKDPIKEGDLISVSFERYGKRAYDKVDQGALTKDELMKQQVFYSIPTLSIATGEYLVLDVADVEFILDKVEETEVEVNVAGLITPEKTLLIN